MLRKEEWSQWKPIEGLNGNYSLDSTVNTVQCLELILSPEKDSNKKLQIKFLSHIKEFRSTYETFRIKDMHEMMEKYDKVFYHKWSFFKVQNSNHLQQFLKQSEYRGDYLTLSHYVITTMEYILDIIDDADPIVEWLS